MSEGNPCCYFHPREVVVGVCALCLKERLLILASKQKHGHHLKPNNAQQRSFSRATSKSSKLISISIPKVFAFGSLLHWSELRHRKIPDDPSEDCYSSLEDSFISIKFGDDGHASWDKKLKASTNGKQAAQGSFQIYNDGKTMGSTGGGEAKSQSVVEHDKVRGAVRWRKRMNHLLQVVRWRRSSKHGSGQAGLLSEKVEVAKRRGWMRSFTRRRTT